jgi:hypothetical protein
MTCWGRTPHRATRVGGEGWVVKEKTVLSPTHPPTHPHTLPASGRHLLQLLTHRPCGVDEHGAQRAKSGKPSHACTHARSGSPMCKIQHSAPGSWCGRAQPDPARLHARASTHMDGRHGSQDKGGAWRPQTSTAIAPTGPKAATSASPHLYSRVMTMSPLALMRNTPEICTHEPHHDTQM